VSIEAEITTDPTTISPYTIGTLVPALVVFCTPLKLKDTLGSWSSSTGFSCGNKSPLAPKRKKA